MLKEVTVWVRDDIIRALRFKADESPVMQKRFHDLADKIKNGDILMIHNPDRDKRTPKSGMDQAEGC